MNKTVIWLVVFLVAAATLAISCNAVPPITYTSTATPPSPSPSPTPTTPPHTITPPTTTTKTTSATPPTTPTKTTASTALYIPAGQQFNGGITTQSGSLYFFVDKGPLCAFGGAPLSGYKWSVAAGSTLPQGTTFDPTTGMFYAGGAGIAIVAGTQTFKMVVSDGISTATGTFTLVVNTGSTWNPIPQAVFQKSLAADIPYPDAKSGMGYGASLYCIGDGGLPWKWSVMDGSLPPGLVLDSASGVIYGTPLPSAAGNTYKFRISVKEGMGADAIGEPTYSITVK
jgi:hypothetical protein